MFNRRRDYFGKVCVQTACPWVQRSFIRVGLNTDKCVMHMCTFSFCTQSLREILDITDIKEQLLLMWQHRRLFYLTKSPGNVRPALRKLVKTLFGQFVVVKNLNNMQQNKLTFILLRSQNMRTSFQSK